MSGFDTRWLDLREPADHRARHVGLLAAATSFAARPGALVADLGCGTGSTFRAFRAAGGGPQPAWRFIDNDPRLLAEARRRTDGTVDLVEADLAGLGGADLAGARLVTASALFDLVSRSFVDRLSDLLAQTGAGLYAALNYDGTIGFSDTHALDGPVVAAFNRHQVTDKGFGPALGPDAAAAVSETLWLRGYRVETADSPWILGAETLALQHAFLDGVAAAVEEGGELSADELAGWLRHRRAAAGRGVSCRVGHVDLLARPPA